MKVGEEVGKRLDGEEFRQHPPEMSNSVNLAIAEMVGSHCGLHLF